MSEEAIRREPLDPRRPPPRRRSWLRTIVAIVVVVVIAVVLAVVLSRCASKGAKGASGRPTTTVAIAKATVGDMPIHLEALGTVTPEATDQINTRVSGMLVQVNFKEGQIVKKGQLLALIDPRPFQAALDQAKGQLLKDQAALADAELNLARYRKLLAQDSIASQTVDTQAALVKQDAAAVVSDQANVVAAALNLSFCKIPAPVSGRVGLRQVDPGNQITANAATPITVLTQLDPIDVVFAVPEDSIAQLASHQSAGGLPVTAYDRTGGTVLANGSLFAIDSQINTTTGTVNGKARFANPGGALFPNQFVNVSVLVETLRNQVIVPTTAIRQGPQGSFVWVLQPNQTVKAQTVKVGPGTAETVSIASGLTVGQTVITQGGDRLREGGKVVLPGQRPARAGGGKGAGGHHRHGGGGGGSAGSDQ
jgi:multidrug efflux system membrane fusion protein